MDTDAGRCERTKFERWRGARRGVAVVALAALVVVGCSGSDESESVDSTQQTTPADSVFDPTNPEGTDAPIPGTAVVLDDDVIIATEDGQIPTTTTEPPVDPDGPDAPPTTRVNADGSPVTIATLPLPSPADVGRIVSLSPTHTETLFALGLGDFVVAVDSESDFPAEAVAVRRDDLFSDNQDLSVLLSLDPDVVIIGEDLTGLAGRLSAEGIASFVGPPATSLDDVYAQIRGVADIVDRPDLAQDVIAAMQFEIGRIQASLPSGGAKTYFHEIDPSLVTITPGSFLDSVYGELGLTSIIETRDSSGVTQVTPDQVIAANPDVILLADADCCQVTADVVAGRAGWSSLSAVSDGAIVELPDDLAFRWSPRVVELIRLVAGGVVAAG